MAQRVPNSPQIQAVIFDMDGLMFNTEDIYNTVGDALLKPRGHEFTLELKLLMMGLPGVKAFDVMVEHCGLSDSAEDLEKESAQLFGDLLPREVRPMPGLLDLLDRIEGRSLPKGIATSSQRRFADIALNQFDLAPRFEFILSAESVENGKPHPDIYLLAAQRMNLDPSQLLVLEDSVKGSRAAASAGANVIAVPTPHSVNCDYSHVDKIATSLNDPIIWQTITAS